MSLDEMLYRVYFLRNKIFRKYLNQVFRCCGKHLPYDIADRIIRKRIDSPVDRERMLYFMNKVSNSFTYGTAMKKTMSHFKISNSAFFRIERLFDQIKVNPITFYKNSDSKSIECFNTLLFQSNYYSKFTGEFFSCLNDKMRLIGSSMQIN